MLFVEYSHLELARRVIPAPSLSLHQVYRHLQEAGGMLRLDRASPKENIHKEGGGVNDLQNMRA